MAVTPERPCVGLWLTVPAELSLQPSSTTCQVLSEEAIWGVDFTVPAVSLLSFESPLTEVPDIVEERQAILAYLVLSHDVLGWFVTQP